MRMLASFLLAIAGAQSWAQSLNPGVMAPSASIVVFASFGCDFSAQAAPALRAIRDRYPDSVAIEFRHLPMTGRTEDLLPHLGAFAADNQGKFVEFHDALFAGRDAPWTRGRLLQLADVLALDLDRFVRDIDDAQTHQRVLADSRLAKALDVTLTPTIYIQGFKLEGLRSGDVLIPIIEDALARAHPLPAPAPSGIEPEKET